MSCVNKLQRFYLLRKIVYRKCLASIKFIQILMQDTQGWQCICKCIKPSWFKRKRMVKVDRQQCDTLKTKIFTSWFDRLRSSNSSKLLLQALSYYWIVFYGYGTHITFKTNIFIKELHLSHCCSYMIDIYHIWQVSESRGQIGFHQLSQIWILQQILVNICTNLPI